MFFGRLFKEIEKTVEHESDDYTNCNWCSWYSHQRIGTRTGGNNGTSRNHKNYCVQSWTSPGSNTPQDTNCTATCPLSRKLFKLGEPDMQDIAGEAEMNS